MGAPVDSQETVFERMAALGEPHRARAMLLLEDRELTVSELCAVLQMPQSSVSRHLKALADGGWVTSRKEGTRRWYGMSSGTMSEGKARLWDVLRSDLASSPAARHDRERLDAVLATRRDRSRAFFSGASGEWDRLRDAMFGNEFFLHALPALLDPTTVIGDLGCGTGRITEALAPFVRQVIAVDGSDEMIAAARERVAGAANVELRRGEIESLPLRDGELDAATLVLVLHHLPDPEQALRDVARVLRPGGRVLVVDMLPHDREEYVHEMGHVWLGFSEDVVRAMLGRAGFRDPRIARLPVDADAMGPALFVAAATRDGTNETGFDTVSNTQGGRR